MFSWFVSLLLLFSYNGKATPAASMGVNGGGNHHLAPADNPQPSPSDLGAADGKGTNGA